MDRYNNVRACNITNVMYFACNVQSCYGTYKYAQRTNKLVNRHTISKCVIQFGTIINCLQLAFIKLLKKLT